MRIKNLYFNKNANILYKFIFYLLLHCFHKNINYQSFTKLTVLFSGVLSICQTNQVFDESNISQTNFCDTSLTNDILLNNKIVDSTGNLFKYVTLT